MDMQTASESLARLALDLVGHAAGCAAGGVALLWVFELSTGVREALAAARSGEPRR